MYAMNYPTLEVVPDVPKLPGRWHGDLVDGTEAGADVASAIAQRAIALRSGAPAGTHAAGSRLAAVFMNASLRTRTSLVAACDMLGVKTTLLSPGSDVWALELRDGVVMDGAEAEHVRDAVGVLSQMHDAVAVRAFASLRDLTEDRADSKLSAFRAAADVPLINLESALYHPMQGFADLATWHRQLGPQLRGKRLTISWAPHPRPLPTAVANQALLTAAQQGMEITVAHPEGFELDPLVTQRAASFASKAGGAFRVSHDQQAACEGAQVVYAKSWGAPLLYRDPEAEAELRASHAQWTITPELMQQTDGAGFMHCLPVRRNVVVKDAVIDGEQSWVQETAGFRLWTAVAFLERLLNAC